MPVHLQPGRSFCRFPTALIVIAMLDSCATASSPIPDLVCQVASVEENARGCMGVPTLVDGELQLLADGTFELDGRYNACYQVEDIRFSGTYLSQPHENGMDLELLATRTRETGSDVQQITRTIGLVNLNSKTLQARFTDTAAVIRSRGQLTEPAPNVQMTCARQ